MRFIPLLALAVLLAGCGAPSQAPAPPADGLQETAGQPAGPTQPYELAGVNVTWVGAGETDLELDIPVGTYMLYVSWASGLIGVGGFEMEHRLSMVGCPDDEGLSFGGAVLSSWCSDPLPGKQTAHYEFQGVLVGRVCIMAAPTKESANGDFPPCISP